MNVLIACEESQRVCTAFRKRGHNAFSCDIIEPSGGHPEWHILGDALGLLSPVMCKTSYPYYKVPSIKFRTMDGIVRTMRGRWDLIIAHPPCTYLTVSGNRWFNVEKYGEKAIKRQKLRDEAVEFFMAFAAADCDKIAIENPIGVMSTLWRKPDQIIQPYQFGHPYTKQTCLWLKGLPKLTPSAIVDNPGKWENQQMTKDGRYGGVGGAWGKDENGKWLRYSDPRVKKERSKTFPGIAEAMAEQWGSAVLPPVPRTIPVWDEEGDR